MTWETLDAKTATLEQLRARVGVLDAREAEPRREPHGARGRAQEDGLRHAEGSTPPDDAAGDVVLRVERNGVRVVPKQVARRAKQQPGAVAIAHRLTHRFAREGDDVRVSGVDEAGRSQKIGGVHWFRLITWYPNRVSPGGLLSPTRSGGPSSR